MIDTRVKRPVRRKASEITEERIRWLWRGRLACGKPNYLFGDPGKGKSTFSACAAGHVTTGKAWPDGAPCEQGSVIILSAEDDAADTLVPRLRLAGANLEKVVILDAAKLLFEDGEQERPVTLSDTDILEQVLDEVKDCRLIIIDPVSAYLGQTDTKNNTRVRTALKPLFDLAEKRQVALLLLSHMNKGQSSQALYRMTDSIAFMASARSAYLWAADEDDAQGNRRLMLPVKNNCGPATAGLACRIIAPLGEEHPVLEWEPDPVSITADSILSRAQIPPDASKVQAAEDFIREVLANGPLPSVELEERAKQAGIRSRTLTTARRNVGVQAVKGPESWLAVLPTGSAAKSGKEMELNSTKGN